MCARHKFSDTDPVNMIFKKKIVNLFCVFFIHMSIKWI